MSRVAPRPPADERVRAVASFFTGNPERILAIASRWQAESRVLESTVAGGSMGTSLPGGARIHIQLTSAENYRPGDVIAMVAQREVVVHRVVARGRGRGNDHLLTRGDALVVPDPPVHRSRVLGLVAEIERSGDWTAVGQPPRGSHAGVWARRTMLASTAVLLAVSPDAARWIVEAAHRIEAAVRARRH